MIRSLVRSGVFSFSLALSNAAIAQPQTSVVMTPVPPQREFPARSFAYVNVLVPGEGTIQFGVTASNTDAVNVLRQVAMRADLQIVVKTGTRAALPNLSIKPCSSKEAVEQVCKVAKLSCELREGIWFVSSLVEPEVKTEATKLDFSFADIKTTEVLQMLVRGFGLKLKVSSAIENSIPFISLNGRTPRGAVDLVAQAADLEVREDGDTLIISPKPAA